MSNEEATVKTSELINFLKGHHGIQKIENKDGLELYAAPNSIVLLDVQKTIDTFAQHPRHKAGHAGLHSLDSLIAHIKLYQVHNSVCFLNEAERRFIVVYDYHARHDGDANWCRWLASYVAQHSDEWKAWKALDGKELDQAEFAEVIEDRIADVDSPAAAGLSTVDQIDRMQVKLASASQMMALSRGLEAKVTLNVADQQRLDNGDRKLLFEATTTKADGSPLTVPGAFLLAIPCFKFGPTYQVLVRLRYRINGNGKCTWTIRLCQADHVVRDALEEMRSRVASECEIPVLQGTP